MIESIIHYIGSLITEISIIHVFKRIINKEKVLKYKHIILFLLIPISQILMNRFGLEIINPIVTILLFMYICRDIFKCEWKESIIYILIIWIISIFLDILTMLITNIIINVNIIKLDIFFLKFLSSIMLSVILIVLSHTKIFINKTKKFYNLIMSINIDVVYIISIVGIIFTSGLISFMNMSSKEMIINEIITCLLTILLLFKIAYLYFHLNELRKTNKYLEKNEEINRDVLNEYKIIKHNIAFQLRGVQSVSNTEAISLIDDMLEQYNDSFQNKYDINHAPNGINGLIYEKINKFDSYNINIETKNNIEGNILEKIGSKSYNDFCEVLGVVLDNALYATIKTEEKVLIINFKELEKEILISIYNTFSGMINIDKIGSVNYTTKKDGHGIGLFSILKKTRVKTDIKIINNVFTHIITIKKTGAH